MIYIITGSSSGIGKACALFYLERGNKVIGLARSNSIEHQLYTHIICDLSKIKDLKKLDLSSYLANDSKVVLINNAGTIGKIERTPEIDLQTFYEVANLNIVALQFLCAHILKIKGFEQVDTIINISSGAGRRPIASWAAYCASKAAVDLFSETLLAEIKELNGKTKIYSVAPGVVDTKMQVAIRSSNEESFSSHGKFVDLKEKNELRTPEKVAELLADLISSPQQGDVICRL